MSQDWTNQHQRRYAIDDNPIQNPPKNLLKKKKMLQKTKNQTFPHTKKKNSDICLQLPEIDFFYAGIHCNLKFRLKNANE